MHIQAKIRQEFIENCKWKILAKYFREKFKLGWAETKTYKWFKIKKPRKDALKRINGLIKIALSKKQ